MIDNYGRKIDYLRISVTDRCNLRCKYCMPAEGLPTTVHDELMSLDEVIRICKVMAEIGIRKIKLTGGEPLIRENLTSLVVGIKAISGIEDVTLTTNGVALAEHIKELAEAGIDAINISLDTLNPELFKEITRRDMHERVLEGIYAALRYPEISLKINCVPLHDSRQDIESLVGLAKSNPLHVRFIEMMPIGMGKEYTFQGEDEIKERIEKAYGRMMPSNKKLGNGPCHYYSLEGFQGKIGFISAMSHKFCGSCNRLRLTSQGFLKACLQYDIGENLLDRIREGCTEEELKALIQRAIARKPEGHRFSDAGMDREEQAGMSQIGG